MNRDDAYLIPHVFTRHKLHLHALLLQNQPWFSAVALEQPAVDSVAGCAADDYRAGAGKKSGDPVVEAGFTSVAVALNNPQIQEVSMIHKKRKARLLLIVQYHAEALRPAGNISANQQRFLDVAASHGKDLEPAGLLAGKRA